MTLSRRLVMGGMLAGVAWPALADAPPDSFPPRRRGDGGRVSGRPANAGDLVAKAALGGSLGYAVADAGTGVLIEASGEGLALPPASVAKVLTTLYALDRLGASHRFSTEVLGTGPIDAGIVQGDLVLAGSGDPTLSTDDLADLAQALAARGVRGATGRFLTWDGALPAVERIASDQPEFVGYNPGLGGLNLNFNRVHFGWARAGSTWRTAMDARSERFVPPVAGIRMAVVPRAAPLFTYGADAAGEDWTVAADALGKGGSRWLPVRRPGAYAGEVFRWLAAARGVVLPAPEAATASGGVVLAAHDSAALGQMLRDMLRFSTNATAEALGLAASLKAGLVPGADPLAASAGAMSDWVDGSFGVTARLVNHSGLGAGSRISAANMVRVLVSAHGGALQGLLRDVGLHDAGRTPVGGSPVRVVAKTGTLNFVSALSGYIQPAGGRTLAFAIFAADRARRDALPMEAREDPPGGRAWLKRARALQGGLVARWAGLHA